MGNRRHFFKTAADMQAEDAKRKRLAKLVFTAASRKEYAKSAGISVSTLANMLCGASNVTDKALLETNAID